MAARRPIWRPIWRPIRRRWAVPPVPLLAWAVAGFLLLPLLAVMPMSFTGERFLSYPGREPSLRHYRALLEGRWLEALLDSALVAVGGTLLALALGGAAAVALWRLSGPGARLVRTLVLAPLIVPAILHAVAFYRAWAALGLLDTHAGLMLVHGMKGAPFVLLSVSAALAPLDPRLEPAARSLGASPLQALRLVVLPNIVPGLGAGALLAFIASWDEIMVALFLTGRAVHTLPKLVWESLSDNLDPAVAALATLMILATAAALALHGTARRAGRAPSR